MRVRSKSQPGGPRDHRVTAKEPISGTRGNEKIETLRRLRTSHLRGLSECLRTVPATVRSVTLSGLSLVSELTLVEF